MSQYSPVLIAFTVHSGNKKFLIILYKQERVLCASLNIFDGQSELHITDILEYGEARSQCNFHEPATRSDIYTGFVIHGTDFG